MYGLVCGSERPADLHCAPLPTALAIAALARKRTGQIVRILERF
jgi:hypothetical protein